MAKSKTIIALAKVMIAAAWADGSVSNDEINTLKDLLFLLPEMTASDWAELNIYIDSPIDQAERNRLVAELQTALTSAKDKKLALSAIEQIVSADGDISAEEQIILNEIQEAIQEADVSVFGKIGNLLGGSLKRNVRAGKYPLNRENYLEDFEKNKVFYNLSRRIEGEDIDFNIPERDLRKLSLAGALMARVAYIDRQVTESEFDSMAKAIQENWGLYDMDAALVAEVAVTEIGKGLDDYRTSRGFFECTTLEERLRFLDALFAVADGDGQVSYQEIEEIRRIAKILKLTHKQFIAAKVKIPRQRRAS